jgi:hypothetical protein
MASLSYMPNIIALSHPAPAIRPVIVPETEEPTDNWDDDFEEDITFSKLQLIEKTIPIPDAGPAGSATVTPTPATLKSTNPVKPTAAAGVFLKKGTPPKQATAVVKSPRSGGVGTPDADDANSKTIRPTQSPTRSTKSLSSSSKSASLLVPPVPPLPKTSLTPEIKGKRLPGSPSMEAIDEDYDDLMADEDELFGKVESFKVGYKICTVRRLLTSFIA